MYLPKAICDANPGLSAENFRIGQVIRIPSTTEPQTMVPVETQSSTVVANNNILGPVESRCRDMHKSEAERNRIQHQP